MKRMYALACAGALVLGAVSLDAEDISAIDKYFRVATVGKLQVNYFDALKKPFELTGFAWRREGEPLYRIPKNFTEKEINRGVLSLARHTSGGTVRFKTDSPYPRRLQLFRRYEPHAAFWQCRIRSLYRRR